MIHHSNPICDECETRHNDGAFLECIESLKAKIESLEYDLEQAEMEIDLLQSELRNAEDQCHFLEREIDEAYEHCERHH